MPKKILLVYESAPGPLNADCQRTFESMGYSVATFIVHPYTTLGYNTFLSKLSHALYQFRCYRTNKKFIKFSAQIRPDIIFLIKAQFLTAKTLRSVKEQSNAQLINWYPDNPFTCWNGNSNEQVLRALPLYDSFAIWSYLLINPLYSAGCRNVTYAPFAYEPSLYEKHFEVSTAEANLISSDVAFIGTWDTEREWWLEQLVHRMPSLNLAIWGNGWDTKLNPISPLRNYLRGSARCGTDMIKILRASKISLNFIRRQNITSHNMRTIEIPAAGGFQLTERTIEQAEILFAEGASIACFATPDELVTKISYYLAHPDERKQIAAAAHIKVKQYTLETVLKQILDSSLEHPVGFCLGSEKVLHRE